MSIKVLVDMNLSPEWWVSTLTGEGWEAVHWSAVGGPRAPDTEIMTWALAHAHIVFTHDLDFGATLALTHAAEPSVLQVRGRQRLARVRDTSRVPVAILSHVHELHDTGWKEAQDEHRGETSIF